MHRLWRLVRLGRRLPPGAIFGARLAGVPRNLLYGLLRGSHGSGNRWCKRAFRLQRMGRWFRKPCTKPEATINGRGQNEEAEPMSAKSTFRDLCPSPHPRHFFRRESPRLRKVRGRKLAARKRQEVWERFSRHLCTVDSVEKAMPAEQVRGALYRFVQQTVPMSQPSVRELINSELSWEHGVYIWPQSATGRHDRNLLGGPMFPKSLATPKTPPESPTESETSLNFNQYGLKPCSPSRPASCPWPQRCQQKWRVGSARTERCFAFGIIWGIEKWGNLHFARKAETSGSL